MAHGTPGKAKHVDDAALVVVALLIALRVRMNPLLVGVQTWLVIEAFAFVAHFPLLVDVLTALRESSFFLVIIVVAVIYLSRSKSLLSVDDVEPGAARRASLGPRRTRGARVPGQPPASRRR